MGTILVVHDELNSLELSVFKKDDRSKPELRYFPECQKRPCEGHNGEGTLKRPSNPIRKQVVLTVIQ